MVTIIASRRLNREWRQVLTKHDPRQQVRVSAWCRTRPAVKGCPVGGRLFDRLTACFGMPEFSQLYISRCCFIYFPVTLKIPVNIYVL